MKHPIAVGIDIGTSLTRVVVCEQEAPHGSLPKILSAAHTPSRGMRHGYVINKDEAAASVREAVHTAESEIGQRIKHATLCIGGIGLGAEYASGVSMVTRADSIISKLDIEKGIADAETKLDLKNKVILHAFPILFKVDDKELPTRPEGIQGFKLEVKVLFITCFQQHLDDLLAVMSDAGVKVTSFTATPIATEQLLLTDLQRNFGCALIDVGSETVSVAVFENGSLTSLHVFGIGSLDITKDIALGLRITPEEAESIKLGVVGFGTAPKKKLDEIIDARLSDIFELVDKYFKKIGRSGLLPAGAILIGAGSRITMIESVAKTILKIPVRTAHLEIPNIKGVLKDQQYLPAYGAAIGIIDRIPAKGGKSFTRDGDDFLSTIKAFFKQLMP